MPGPSMPLGWNALPESYRIPASAPSLAEAQRYCERLARSHYENFSVATWFLPRHLRQHFFNVYAYCRISDDLGDEVGDPVLALQLLNEWEAELNQCYAGSPRHPVFVALSETVIAEAKATPQFLELMGFEVERARAWFARGLALPEMVDRDLAIDLQLFSRGGQEILNAIERQHFDVLARRPVISRPRKLGL